MKKLLVRGEETVLTSNIAKLPTHLKTMIPLLMGAVLLLVGVATIAAAESRSAPGEVPPAAGNDKNKQPEPGECPIKKMIDGKLYCFQNDPALTKPQGGG